MELAMQKVINATNESATELISVNFNENIKGAITKKFLIQLLNLIILKYGNIVIVYLMF